MHKHQKVCSPGGWTPLPSHTHSLVIWVMEHPEGSPTVAARPDSSPSQISSSVLSPWPDPSYCLLVWLVICSVSLKNIPHARHWAQSFADPFSHPQNTHVWDFPGGPVVKTLPSNAGGAGSIPGWGAKTPHASRPKTQNIKQKQCCNKCNKDFKNGPHKEKKIFKKKRTPMWSMYSVVQMGNWGSEPWSNLPKATEEEGTDPRALSSPSPYSICSASWPLMGKNWGFSALISYTSQSLPHPPTSCHPSFLRLPITLIYWALLSGADALHPTTAVKLAWVSEAL